MALPSGLPELAVIFMIFSSGCFARRAPALRMCVHGDRTVLNHVLIITW